MKLLRTLVLALAFVGFASAADIELPNWINGQAWEPGKCPLTDSNDHWTVSGTCFAYVSDFNYTVLEHYYTPYLQHRSQGAWNWTTMAGEVIGVGFEEWSDGPVGEGYYWEMYQVTFSPGDHGYSRGNTIEYRMVLKFGQYLGDPPTWSEQIAATTSWHNMTQWVNP